MESENPVKKDDILCIYVDGAARRNPGPAAIAFIFLKNDTTPIKQYSEYLGEKTNNVAEYTAVIRALEYAVEYTRWRVKVFSDSRLVINQINGRYRVKKQHLKELLDKVLSWARYFEKVEFLHVPRDNKFIKKCDELCKRKLDEIQGRGSLKNNVRSD